MSEWKRFTVKHLIGALEQLAPDAEVAVRWDGARSLFEIEQDDDGAIVLNAGWWGDFDDGH